MSIGSSSRKLVVAGLGNYTHPLTKHSIGQLVLQNLAIKAASLPASSGSSTLLYSKPNSAYLTKITLDPSSSPNSYQPSTSSQGINLSVPLEILFVKPKQLMNISGPSILTSSKTFLNPTQILNQYRIITLQDDLDLSPNTIKLQRGGSPRGHNGIRSLERTLNHKAFYRIRIGIGRGLKGEVVSDWVMSPLTRDEVRACEVGGSVLEGVWKLLTEVGWKDEVIV